MFAFIERTADATDDQTAEHILVYGFRRFVRVPFFFPSLHLMLNGIESDLVNNRFVAAFDKILPNIAVIDFGLFSPEIWCVGLLKNHITDVLFVAKNLADAGI